MRDYFNKNIPICLERVKLKRYSLNCEEFRDNPFTFSSGEGGPRAVVVEESTVCTARYTMHKTKLGHYEVLRFIISEFFIKIISEQSEEIYLPLATSN
jgi:hypothetical protein